MTVIRPLWITRGSTSEGVLDQTVTIWRKKPTRCAIGKLGAWWTCVETVCEIMSVDLCFEKYGVIPDNNKQLIRLGNEPKAN